MTLLPGVGARPAGNEKFEDDPALTKFFLPVERPPLMVFGSYASSYSVKLPIVGVAVPVTRTPAALDDVTFPTVGVAAPVMDTVPDPLLVMFPTDVLVVPMTSRRVTSAALPDSVTVNLNVEPAGEIVSVADPVSVTEGPAMYAKDD
jgi:hypothetical protein